MNKSRQVRVTSDNVAMRVRIGGNIRRVRDAQGLSQTALGRMLEVNQGYMNKIENGKIGTSIPFLEEIASKLGCDISEFFKLVVVLVSLGFIQ